MHISDQLHCETAGVPELDIVDILRGANAQNSAHNPPVNRKAAKLLKRKLKLQYQHWLWTAAEALRAEDAINQGRPLLPKGWRRIVQKSSTNWVLGVSPE